MTPQSGGDDPRHPGRGVDPGAAPAHDAGMHQEPTPKALPAAAQQLQTWIDLRDRLQQLHAELEYLRLMLRLRG